MSAFMLSFRRALLPALFAVLLCALAALPALADGSARTLPLKLDTGARAVDSCMDWLLDATGSLSVEEAASETMRDQFKALHVVPFAKQAGSLWLRFTLPAKSAEELRPATLMLDMGPGVPGSPTLYVPRVNPADRSVQWQAQNPRQGAVFVLPEAGAEVQTCYIRLLGVPGPWLSPMLRSPHDAATALERMAHPAVLVALAMVMLLCLLRSLGERGQWRMWTALYCGAALAHAWYGAPLTPAGHIEMTQAAAVIAPGLALMLLPHVGRQFMHTAQFSRMIDSQYMLLSLPGMLLILLPLIPTFTWTSRLLPLWPLGTLILVPTTLGAWLGGLVGARRFLLGCLLPPIGAAAGLALPAEMVPPDLLASAPMWGVALGALIVAGSASVPLPQRDDPNALPHMTAGGLDIAPHAQDHEDIMMLGAPLSAPATARAQNTLQHGDLLSDALPHTSLAPDALPHMDTSPRAATGKPLTTDTLRLHVDSLLYQAAALRQSQLPSGPHRQAEQLEQALRALQSLLGEAPAPRESGKEEVFNLQRLLRDVHGKAQEAAAGNNTALSWYMPPHMGLWYKGDPALISDILDMLASSAVQATTQGAIQISVRRMPESVDPGHLFFTITDTGTGLPPHDRPALALVRAWEAAGAHHGSLSMECGPRGTAVSFSLHLTAVRQDGAAAAASDAASVLIVDENPSNRQLLSFMLEDLPCATREARTPAEAAEAQAQNPAALIIMNGQLDEAGIRAVHALRRTEQETGAAPAVLLALTDSDSQWQPLRDAGFSHALPKPVTRKALRSTVQQLLPQPTSAKETATDGNLDAVKETAQNAAAEQPIPDLFGTSPAASAMPTGTARATTMQGTAAQAPAAQGSAGQDHAIPDLFGTASAPRTPEARSTESAMPTLRMDAAPAAAPAAAPTLGTLTAPMPQAEAARYTSAEEDGDDLVLDLAEPLATVASTAGGRSAQAAPSATTEALVMPSLDAQAAQATTQNPSVTQGPATMQSTSATQSTPAMPGVQARAATPAAQKATAKQPALLRDHEAELYVPDASLKLDPDALRDPAIRLLKATAADGPANIPVETAKNAATQDYAAQLQSAPKATAQPAAPAQTTPRPQTDEQPHASAADNIRVIPAAEVRRGQTAQQESFSTSLPEPAEAQDPVSAALQRVKALLGSRSKQPPQPAAPEEEEEEVLLPHMSTSADDEAKVQSSLPQNAQPSTTPSPAQPRTASQAQAGQPVAAPAQTSPSDRAQKPAAVQAKPMPQPAAASQTAPAPKAEPQPVATAQPKPVVKPVSQPAAAAAQPAPVAKAAPQPSISQTSAPVPPQQQAQPETPTRAAGTAARADLAASQPNPNAAPSAAAGTTSSTAGQPAQTRASRYDPFDGLDEPIRQMLLTLDVNIVRARQAFHSGNTKSVSLLAAGIAQEAEKRGLRVLSRMGRCVESAAAAGDKEALADLLPELEHAVERNRIAFTSEK